MVPLRKQDFTIAIICALTSEADAVESLFDETYDRHSRILRRQPGDTNAYVTGRIGEHKVVLCYMPGMGGIPASMVASNLRFSYTAVELALAVGDCGGAPVTKSGKEVFLADVIISESVVQYDFGRQYPGGFECKTDLMSTLGRPGPEIRSLLASLRSKNAYHELHGGIVSHLRAGLQFEDSPKRPHDDVLYDSSYVHKHRAGSSSSMCLCFEEDTVESFCSNALRASCSETGCDGFHVKRIRNGWHNPSIYIGAIASADTVMKSGKHRDMIIHGENEEIFGFEMEGAGVWDNIPCIVIKGVCDYSDSHKNKEWQPYAALVAVATAKAFLSTRCPASREGS